MQLSFRHLRAFEAVDRFGGVARAAEALNTSASAVSTALKDLEGIVGMPLFTREARGLALNHNGIRLKPEVQSMLQMAGQIQDRSTRRGLSGMLRIVASHGVGTTILPHICARFLAAVPEADVTLEICTMDKVMERISTLSADIGFMDGVSTYSNVVRLRLCDAKFVVFCSPSSPLAGSTVTMTDVMDWQWCLHPRGSAMRLTLLTALSQLGLVDRLDVRMECENIDVIKRVVAEGNLVSALPYIAIQEEVEAGRLATIALADLKDNGQVEMVTAKFAFESELRNEFCRIARETFLPGPQNASSDPGA